MIYHDFQGLKLSALGMGTMRLPVMEGVRDALHGNTRAPQADRVFHPAQIMLVVVADAAGRAVHRRNHADFFVVTKGILRQAVTLAYLFNGHRVTSTTKVYNMELAPSQEKIRLVQQFFLREKRIFPCASALPYSRRPFTSFTRDRITRVVSFSTPGRRSSTSFISRSSSRDVITSLD